MNKKVEKCAKCPERMYCDNQDNNNDCFCFDCLVSGLCANRGLEGVTILPPGNNSIPGCFERIESTK